MRNMIHIQCPFLSIPAFIQVTKPHVKAICGGSQTYCTHFKMNGIGGLLAEAGDTKEQALLKCM